MFIEQFKNASGEGAVLELRLRMLAAKIPELKKFAYDQKLQDIENEIIKHFLHMLSDEEKNLLALCRQLRNKILHCDFSEARKRLVSLGAEPHAAGVKKVDLHGLDTNQIADKIHDIISGNSDSYECVSNSEATTSRDVFGWLMEVGAAGDLDNAVEAFRRAIAILDKLVGTTLSQPQK